MFLVDTDCQTQRLRLFNQPHLINPISWGGHIGLTRLIWCEQWTVLLLLHSVVQSLFYQTKMRESLRFGC